MAKKKVIAARVSFQWNRLQTMWNAGKSYLEMAKALDSHFNEQGNDPTKATRARISIAVNKGIRINGKLVRFKRRSKAPVEKKSKAMSVKVKKVPAMTVPKKKSKATGKKAETKPAATVKKVAPKKVTLKKSAIKPKAIPTVERATKEVEAVAMNPKDESVASPQP